MDNERPICLTCPYWRNYENSPDDEFGNKGECRRHAPRAIVMSYEHDDFEDDQIALWPLTSAVEWCGDHPDFTAVR